MKFLCLFGRNLLYVALTGAFIVLAAAGIILPTYLAGYFFPDYKSAAGAIGMVLTIIVIWCAGVAYDESIR